VGIVFAAEHDFGQAYRPTTPHHPVGKTIEIMTLTRGLLELATPDH
jgi:hypothetical protein